MTTLIALDLKKNAGVTLDLAKEAPSLKKLTARVSWEMHPVHGKSLTDGFDLDLFVFALDKDGKVNVPADVTFFNNKDYGNGAIVLPKDERGGGSEEVYFDLPKVPTDRQQLDLYVFIFEAEVRKQTFGMITNARVELINSDDGKILQAYALNESYSQDNALHVGSLVRNGSGWNFNPVGMGANAGPNDVIAAYC